MPAETEWRRSAVDVRYVMLDGQVWLTETNTVSCSDATIAPLVTSTARQLTGLTAANPSRAVATDERGNATETWTTVNDNIVTRHRRVPYATNVAETTLRYGDVVREVSVSGVVDTYAYDGLNRQVSHTNGRGSTSQTQYNALGLRAASIDALGNRTAYAYDRYGNLAAVTNPLGNAVVYEYDLRGRRTYEGGATYPVRYTYDVFGNKTTMTTYRNESLGPSSGDVTTWRYDEASNCMTNKVYADGKGPKYDYTPDGRLSQRIWARGIVTDYSYDNWGSLTNTVYSDGTPTVTLFYDAMGRQTNAVDAAGITTFRYDDYGSLTNETVVGAAGENTIVRHWDAYGRTTGYSLVGRAAPSAPQRQTAIGYDPATGRIATMLANGSDVPFAWSYLPGSDLKSSLAYPNGLTASWTYDANGQLLQVRNAVVATAPSPSETEVISQYDYVYDNAGRRVSCAKSGSSFTQNDALSYGYNEKSELTNAVAAVDSDYRYAYDFDEIGNRESANERGTNAVYMANQLNQYTAVDDFTPQFDDDGNQTLVKTTTGVWSVAYNGENRPVLWTGGTQSAVTNIVMSFDRMGRRVEYLETVDGGAAVSTSRHHRFVYDGYLCVQRLDASAGNAVDLVFVWDALEKVATKPLMVEKPGKYKMHVTHDGNKNVSELVFFSGGSGIAAHYEYAPFGALTASTRSTSVTAYDLRTYNPFCFSSEYADDTLGLVYYNYRHYNPMDGRWTSRDPLGVKNYYAYVQNSFDYDILGLLKFNSSCKDIAKYCEEDVKGIIAELSKVARRYSPRGFPLDDKSGAREKWRQKNEVDPLWAEILKIYKRRMLVDGKGNIKSRIWKSSDDVRMKLQKIKNDLQRKDTEVICCPLDPSGKLCGDKSVSAMFVKPDDQGTASARYRKKIVICPSAMSKNDMISRNGGCGCILMHELMHKHGMQTPATKDVEAKRPIENAMIEIEKYILRELKDRNCKGYDVK